MSFAVSPNGNTYANRILGRAFPATVAPRATLTQIAWTFVGSFASIAILGALHNHLEKVSDSVLALFLIGSFGAQATLVFAAPRAPLAQPWNCIFGNTISAIVGVAVSLAFDGEYPAIAGALAVSLAISVMQFTRALHPPGGATALIAVIGNEAISEARWNYVVFPVLVSSLILVAVGLLLNNVSRDEGRAYPSVWDAAEVSRLCTCCHPRTGDNNVSECGQQRILPVPTTLATSKRSQDGRHHQLSSV